VKKKKNLILLLILYTCAINNSHGISLFLTPILIADKTNGKLTLHFPNTDEEISTPALYGKVKSDIYDIKVYNGEVKKNNITPSGEYTVTKAYSDKYNRPMLVFIVGKKRLVSIHPVYLGSPKQKRSERLKTSTPSDNRITGGCINVPDEFYYKYLDNLPNGTNLYIKNETEQLI